MFAQLPAELKLAIAYFVRLHSEGQPLAALRSLSLVSKSWSTAAQIALFYRIRLHSSMHFRQLTTHLYFFPHLSGYVRDVQVNIRERDAINLSDVLNMTSMLPNLVALEIGRSFFVMESEASQIVPTPLLPRNHRRLETLRLSHFSGVLDAFDAIFRQFSVNKLCISGAVRLYQAKSSASSYAWSLESAVSSSTIQRLEINQPTLRLFKTSPAPVLIRSIVDVSILHSFMRGTLQSLRCPVVDGKCRLAPLVALFKSGLGYHLSDLELIVADRDVQNNSLFSSVEDHVEHTGDEFGPILHPPDQDLSLRLSCPRLKSLALSLPLLQRPHYQSTSIVTELPEWQYALRLIASTHPMPLSDITIFVECHIPTFRTVAAFLETVLAQLNWTRLDEIFGGCASLQVFEILFRQRWDTTSNIPKAAPFSALLKLDTFLEEQMPVCASRGILRVETMYIPSTD
ncbi:hypothetical protein EIP91_008421 [Steccherinum ochraceum]|uniref:F-box domain-containing protein n=1 Tax=Steccherinum ochraceum TaxID=92696 RepID=A0A4R0R2V7_9APHY|nr:hypothetical protein EIP91_008421 [Steccherinum ochraceum]